MISDSTSAELLYRVSQKLNSSLDLDEVLGKVLRLTVEATGANWGSLFLLDEAGNVIRQILARPKQPPEVSSNIVKKVMSEGLAGWVYEHREPALVSDTSQDERWVRLPNDDLLMGAALVIPLLYQDDVNGVMALHHTQINFFKHAHLSLAMGIAGQAATAIENARLYTQIKREHESLYALISGMPIPVLVVSDGQIIFRNRVAKETLPVGPENMPLADLMGGQELAQALERLQHTQNVPVEIRWPDDRVFNITINHVYPQGTVVALHDISYLKELDEMKTLFVETVSHDLKSPLTAIHGYGTLLTMSKELTERDRSNVGHILDTTKKMQALIENLLDLAEIETGVGGQVEPCNIADIAHDVLSQYQLQIEEKDISLSVELPHSLPKVLADPLRLSQVMANYLSNAVKYTPEEGCIAIRGQSSNNELSLEVSDTGPGIPPAAQPQLFQKFYRVIIDNGIPPVEGNGLGLSIVKAIIEGYGGRVWVKSEVGAGSTFGCALPVLDE